MDTIVRDVTPTTLLSASYEHFVAYELYCAQNPNGEIFENLEYTLAISGTPSPI